MRPHRRASLLQTLFQPPQPVPSLARRVRRLLVAAALVATTLAVGRTVHAASGSITQFRVFGTCICQGIASGSDGALWFTEFYDNKVGRITTSGSVTQLSFRVSPNIANYIAAGPDGALWVTLLDEIHGQGKIGRITTQGARTIYLVPGTSYLFDITAGPDGNLWFTDNDGRIDRITTAGQVTEFPVSVPRGAYPEHITAGPDGNLWFTVYNAALIGKITTTGQVTLYTLPGTSTLTNAIAAGPDGALWFTRDGEGAQIGRITTAGTVTLYGLPRPHDYTYSGGMATGPDGTLWFTRTDASADLSWVGHITTSGQVTQYAIPAPGGGPGAITQGPDGAMWFAESTGYIGRVTTS